MGDISFAQYLIEKGTVSKGSLVKALELMEVSNIRFDDIALSMKLLTAADIELVDQAQLTEDLYFGDMAIKLGLLTRDQVHHISTLQKSKSLHLGQALVSSGALTESELPDLMDGYKQSKPETSDDLLTIPKGMPHADLCQIAADLTNKMLSRMIGLSFLPGTCVAADVVNSSDITATISFNGYAEFKYIFSVSTATRNAIARAMLRQDNVDDEPLELLEDAVKEFINTVAGKVVSRAVDMGVLLGIEPPEISHEGKIEIPQDHSGVLFPMYLKNDDVADLGISMRKEAGEGGL